MKSLLISVDINLDSMFLYKCGTFYIDAEKNCSWIYCLSMVQQSFSYLITHNLNVFIYNDFHQFLFYNWNLSDPFGASINC